MIKSFIKFYLIQCHKNVFHDELFLSVYSILQTELYFPIFVKSHSQILGWIAYKALLIKKKNAYLEKKSNS